MKPIKLKYKYWDNIKPDSGELSRCLASGELSESAVCLRYENPGVCPYWHRVDVGCGEYDICGYPTRQM